MYNCGGKVGRYLGIYNSESSDGYGNICRIQAWSIKANDFEFTERQERLYQCSPDAPIVTRFTNSAIMNDPCVFSPGYYTPNSMEGSWPF
jgi:hypothetical protein